MTYKLFKSDEKRIVYAYDELQNLSKSSMPSTKEMFGVDSNGNPLVSISNNLDDPSQPKLTSYYLFVIEIVNGR